MQIHAIRLTPGQDLKLALSAYAVEHAIAAAWIITCVGSLTEYHLRFANQQQGTVKTGFFEILSLSGTLSIHGSHLHTAVADSEGRVTGGHLLEGCRIYTTAEIVIGESSELVFRREDDVVTGWKELVISLK